MTTMKTSLIKERRVSPTTGRNRTEELQRRQLCRLNAEMPLSIKEALKVQAKKEELHLHQLVRRYLQDGLRKAGWTL